MNWRGLPSWRPEGENTALTDASPSDAAVDEALAALAAAPRRHELEGLAAPLAAYRTTFTSASPVGVGTRKAFALSGFAGLVGAKAAAAVGGIALGLGATALVAAVSLAPTSITPRPVAPGGTSTSATPTSTGDSSPKASSSGEGVGPDATGPAAHGLCTAWANHQAKGDSPALDTPPMRNLAEAAGGATRIAAYCATIPHPGKGRGADNPGRDKSATGKSNGKGNGADKDAKRQDKDARSPAPTRTTPATPGAKPTPRVTPTPSNTSTPSPSDSSTNPQGT